MPWYDPRTWIASDDGKSIAELQSEGDALDARLAQLNAERYNTPASPIYNPAAYQVAEYNRARGETGNVSNSVKDAFNEGFGEGYSALTSGARETLRAPFKLLTDILPWQAWVAGAIALFLYMGGAPLLRNILKPK